MGDIFQQLGHLFVQTIPTVIFVFLLFVLLDRLFFRPVSAVLKQREEATSGALARARQQAETTEAKTKEYEATFQAARQEVYRQREAERHARLSERDVMMREARQKSEKMVQDAQGALAQEVAAAKAELDRTSRPLAEEISRSLLGRDTLPGGAGGALNS